MARVTEAGWGDVSPADAEDALARALAAEPIRSSPRTAAFLDHVVREALAGRGGRIRERDIALAALGRPESFDPRLDPAVRVQAVRVRAALARYYEDAGAGDPVRIALDKGTYAPRFLRTAASPAPASDGARAPTLGPGILVTTFVDMTADGETLHRVTPGLSEALAAELSRYPGCRAMGPVSLDSGGAALSAAMDEGRAAGAEFVVVGSVHSAGGSLRVAIRLVDVDTGEVTYSEMHDRRLGDDGGFAVVDGIVRRTASAIADYRGAVHLRASPHPPPAGGDPVVRDAMRRYFAYMSTFEPDQHLDTVVALAEAVRREPDNILVLGMHAGLCLADARFGRGAVDDPLATAEDLARRATGLDPSAPHAIAALAWLALLRGEADVARQRAEQLLLVCPHHPTFMYRAAVILAVTGDLPRGVALIREALALNPNLPGYVRILPVLDLCREGRLGDAISEAYRVEMPGLPDPHLVRAIPLALEGRLEAARAEVEAARALVPDLGAQRDRLVAMLPTPPELMPMALAALDRVPGSA